MARTNTPDTLPSLIKALQTRLDRVENARRSQIAVLAADPTHPIDGDVWLRSDTGAYRVRVGGVTKTATLT